MGRFITKPVEKTAVRITEKIEIDTLEGVMVGNPGDWLITGLSGEKYPCKDAIFRKTYDPVDEEAKDLFAVSREEIIYGNNEDKSGQE